MHKTIIINERRKEPRLSANELGLKHVATYVGGKIIDRLRDPAPLTTAEIAGFQNLATHLLEVAQGED